MRRIGGEATANNGVSGDSIDKADTKISGRNNQRPNDSLEKAGMDVEKVPVAVRSGFLSSTKLGAVCTWEFMCDKDSMPEREIGYDERGEIVWLMPYAIETSANSGKPESVVVHFTMKDGYPARQRTDNAEYVKITYDDKNGYETCHEFRDREGNKTQGPDGVYAQSLEYYPSGQLKKQASLGVKEEYVIDEAGMLTNEQVLALNELAEEISLRQECGVYVIITKDMHGYRESNYAQGIFMNYDLGYDRGDKDGASGVLLAIAYNESFFDCTAYGAAQGTFTTSKLDRLNDIAYDYLSAGDWKADTPTMFRSTPIRKSIIRPWSPRLPSAGRDGWAPCL